MVVAPPQTKVVNKSEAKVDAVKLAKGRPVFTDDMELPGMLYAALLTSPYAHARIRDIDTEAAERLPGVHAVLTYKNTPRVLYTSGGQSYPNPPPYDQVSLDNKVRHMGDRVAVVAAETPEIAQEALRLIRVDYEVLPVVLDPEEAMQAGAPVIHDEPDAVKIHDASRNIVHHLHAAYNDVEAGFAAADYVFEGEYRTHQVQQASIEPHICITWWDEDDRLVVRTSTQVPFHVRRMLAPLIGLPVKRIRVIKPRLGGGFGGKQEMLIEDLCAHLTLVTGRPVRLETTRSQEFTSARSRHPEILRYKTGVRKDGTLTAMELRMVADFGRLRHPRPDRAHRLGFPRPEHLQGRRAQMGLLGSLHQQANARRLPRLRRAAGAVCARDAHGGDRPGPGLGPDRVQAQKLGQRGR